MRLARSVLVGGVVMPSLEHEVIAEVVCGFPEILRELLGDRLGLALDPVPVRVADPDFTSLVPTEFRADGLVVFGEPPSHAFVVEIQRSRDEGKLRSWPLYAAAAHAELGCACWVVVIAPDPRVAAWAARPISNFQPGCNFAPVVLGPDEIPRITDAGRARASPGLAMLSAIVHANQVGDAEVAIAAVDGLGGLDPERARLYFRVLQGILNEAVFAAVEAHMEQHKIPYRIPFARKAFEEGQLEGGVLLMRRAVLALVGVRLGAVPADVRERIEACTEVAVLERWHEAVARAADQDGVRAALGE